MGVGKTTAGKQLAKSLNRDFYDSDYEIEKASGRTITGYFKDYGEKEFRNRDDEFNDTIESKKEMMEIWEQGWNVLFDTLEGLSFQDLEKINYTGTKVIQ